MLFLYLGAFLFFLILSCVCWLYEINTRKRLVAARIEQPPPVFAEYPSAPPFDVDSTYIDPETPSEDHASRTAASRSSSMSQARCQ